MNLNKQAIDPNIRLESGTAATNHHLSDSLDWSSIAAQIKNQMVIVPVYSEIQSVAEIKYIVVREKN